MDQPRPFASYVSELTAYTQPDHTSYDIVTIETYAEVPRQRPLHETVRGISRTMEIT